MDEVCSCLCLKGSLEIMKTYVLLAVSLWICVCAHTCMRVLYILTIFLIPQTLNMSVIHFMGIVSNDGLDFGCPD